MTRDASVEHDKTRTIKLDVDHVFHSGKLVFVAASEANGHLTFRERSEGKYEACGSPVGV